MMDSQDLRSLPENLDAVRDCSNEDIVISSRILNPLLRIEKSNGELLARLYGVVNVRGERRILPALSLNHNWVADDKTIRPLPSDIPSVIDGLFAGYKVNALGFPDVLALMRLPQDEIAIEVDDEVLRPANADAKDLGDNLVIEGLDATLYPYQASGIKLMDKVIRTTGGLLLADEMGLGKTLQIIGLMLLNLPDEASPALIVCPTSLITNWQRELAKFAPGLSFLIHRGPQRAGVPSGLTRAQVMITTYDTVVNDISIFQRVNWGWVICDEAQALKNPLSERRITLASLPRRFTIPVTGTPVENTLLDMFSLLDFAIPGLLGSEDYFREMFADDNDAATELNRLVAPVVLRRRVHDVADDLPDRIDSDIPIPLGNELALKYNEVRRQALENYPVAGGLVATGQLQLFCAHPWIQGSGHEVEDAANGSSLDRSGSGIMTPKVHRTTEILKESFRSGRKVLIFSLFNSMGDILMEALDYKEKIYWNSINGSTPQELRQNIVDEFEGFEGNACLILNPRAAGAGLNITGANVVIHYTQVWNPAIEAQASARAHRRGQTDKVFVYRLFYERTVEEVMLDRSQWKSELGDEAVPVFIEENDCFGRALAINPEQI
ncbi:MAG: DEAD/DEAH box helicase [Litorivicinaceae bacterium]|nr:DEAD/DEAH box helicase [Litorivicinaceae bacterium]